jgi:hypothetical protein
MGEHLDSMGSRRNPTWFVQSDNKSSLQTVGGWEFISDRPPLSQRRGVIMVEWSEKTTEELLQTRASYIIEVDNVQMSTVVLLIQALGKINGELENRIVGMLLTVWETVVADYTAAFNGILDIASMYDIVLSSLETHATDQNLVKYFESGKHSWKRRMIKRALENA